MIKPNKDLYVECNDLGLNAQEFEQTFCNQCKNRTCVRAGWAFTKWDKRILTQVDRLIENPNIALKEDSSRWDNIDDFEAFREQNTVEVWGVQEPKKDIIVVKNNEDKKPTEPSIPTLPIPITPTQENESIPIKQEPQTNKEVLNTNTTAVRLEEPNNNSNPTPKNFKKDPWEVTETLKIGGTFKMGGNR